MISNNAILEPQIRIQEVLDFPERSEEVFHYLLKRGFFPQKGGKCLLSFFLLNFINLGGLTLREKEIINSAFEHYELNLPALHARKQFSIFIQAKQAINEMIEARTRNFALYGFLEIWSKIKKKPTSRNQNLANSVKWLVEKMVKEFDGAKKGVQMSVAKFLYTLLISHLAE